MNSPAPRLAPGLLTSSTSPSDGGQELLQERMALLGKVAGGLTLVFFFVVQALGGSFGSGAPGLVDPQTGAILLVAVVYGLLWGVSRGRPRSLAALHALEMSVTVVACVGCAIHGWVGPGAEPYRFDAALGVNNMLVVRAILLPSSVRRTAAVGALGTLVILVPAFVRVLATPAGLDPNAVRLEAALFLGWAVVAVAVSVVVSRAVYDLRRDARAARRLGQYRLEERIGAGGMGEVYRARHAMLRRPTAIKLLRPERAGEDALASFEREVQATSQLSHPNTVAIYDYGRTADRVFYYAMELLPGVDLRRLVLETGPMSPARAVHVLLQICGSLAEAHAAGLVHRDVKAANVILCRRGGVPDVVKVVDFGLVTRIATSDIAEAGEGQIVGTPAYLAPEGWRGDAAADPRADLYALGVLGYALLTGELPFGGETLAVCSAHLFTAPPAPSVRAAQPIPPALDAIVLRCLEKEPDRRPQSADALAAELRSCDGVGAWTVDDAERWWGAHPDLQAREGADPSPDRLETTWVVPR